MDEALNKTSGEIYTYIQFQNMSPKERSQFKGKLICPNCKQKAYFRRKSRDGKKACFAADHLKDCDLKSSNRSNSDSEEQELVEKINVKHDIFSLSLTNNFKVTSSSNNVIGNNSGVDIDKNKKYVLEPSKEEIRSITLRNILKYAEKGILHKHNFEIKIGNKKFKVKKIVNHFNEVTYEMENEVKIFWGETYNAGNKNWINTKTKFNKEDYLSIFLDDQIKDDFWNGLGIKYNEWPKDINIIIYGMFRVSNTNKKPYIYVSRIENIYIDKRKVHNEIKK